MSTEIVNIITSLGQTAIFLWAAYMFYKDGRARDRAFISYLEEQNKMLFSWIQQIAFFRSPAISPGMPPLSPISSWMTAAKTDLMDESKATAS